MASAIRDAGDIVEWCGGSSRRQGSKARDRWSLSLDAGEAHSILIADAWFAQSTTAIGRRTAPQTQSLPLRLTHPSWRRFCARIAFSQDGSVLSQKHATRVFTRTTLHNVCSVLLPSRPVLWLAQAADPVPCAATREERSSSEDDGSIEHQFTSRTPRLYQA